MSWFQACCIHWCDLMFICREEIKEIEQKVQKERDRYKLSTQSMSAGLSAIPMISINDTVYIILVKIENCVFPIEQNVQYAILDNTVPGRRYIFSLH